MLAFAPDLEIFRPLFFSLSWSCTTKTHTLILIPSLLHASDTIHEFIPYLTMANIASQLNNRKSCIAIQLNHNTYGWKTSE
ncbi:unnamed protein product [Sphenostylis stenocarpa]|uniref:Uncharacterized protein n=1 Tax=Sphenostylis stenocarpa TaxID=92480 RepID=A0AA86VQD1_9FABA|nr:unnamed protein product [Sphenostylis stenocarpa]